jgi:hypothetical protein
MLRFVLIGPLTALAMMLGGCNAETGKIDLTAVQNALKATCGFELVASSALTQINTLIGNNPWLTSAQAVADLVCSKVNVLQERRGAVAGQPVTVDVNGTKMTGKYVR